MSISQPSDPLKKLLRYHGKRPDSLVSGGMESLCPLIPENVIVRVDSNSAIVPKETYIHRRMILKTILSGKLTALIDGLSFPMEVGDSVLFFPFQFHSSIDAPGMPRHSFIAVSFMMPGNDFAPLLPLKNHVLRLPPEDLEALNDIAAAFYGAPGAVSSSRALLELSGILVRQLEMTESDRAVRRGEPKDDAYNDVCDFIRHNFDKKISLKSLAAEFGRSPESIRKIFQKYHPGVTPGKLIAKLQIQEAVGLLENTDSPIGMISSKCGFSDTYTFSKKFKRIIGLSPREYRVSRRHGGGASGEPQTST